MMEYWLDVIAGAAITASLMLAAICICYLIGLAVVTYGPVSAIGLTMAVISIWAGVTFADDRKRETK